MTEAHRDTDVTAVVDRVVSRLAPRFPDTPRSEIGDLVRGEVATFIDAPVHTYLEVLVQRRVAERMSGAEPAP
jgi:hypothetical protein